MEKAILLFSLFIVASVSCHGTTAVTLDNSNNLLNPTINVPTGTVIQPTGSGTVQATSVPLPGITGAGTGVLTAAANATNSAGGILVSDYANTLQSLFYFPVGPTGINITCIGDSLVEGYGVVSYSPFDVRQTWEASLACLSFQNCNIYNCGNFGFTTHSQNAVYATNMNYSEWQANPLPFGSSPPSLGPVAVSTCPSAITATNGWAVIYGSGRDYTGTWITATTSTSSTTVTGMSIGTGALTYTGDALSYSPPITAGDAVTCTTAGVIPAGTTVVSVGTTSMVLSQTPTLAGSYLLTFTPHLTSGSTFYTALTALIGQAHTSGYKVALCTVTPANTTDTPVNGGIGYGYFQANRLVENTQIKAIFAATSTTGDILIDLASDPIIGTFNANLWASDLLHPNGLGNQRIAYLINNALMSTYTPSSYWNGTGSESVTRQMLPTATVYSDTGGYTLAGPITVTTPSATTTALNIAGDSIAGIQYPADLFIRKTVGGIGNVWDWHWNADPTSGTFSLIDSTTGTTMFQAQEGAAGSLYVGSTTKTGGLYLETGGALQMNGTALTVYLTGGNLLTTTGGVMTYQGNTLLLYPTSSSDALGFYGGSNYGYIDFYAGGGVTPAHWTLVNNSSGFRLCEGASAVGTTFFTCTPTTGMALNIVGNTIYLKGGSNAASGTVTLSSGAATITSTAITTSSVIFLTLKTSSGTPGLYMPGTAVSAGSATVSGLSTDNSTYNWGMIQVNQ